MKRLLILMLAVATLISWSLPAIAKGKPQPPETMRYSVEITYEGPDGIATTCTDPTGTPLTLEVTRNDARPGEPSHFEATGAALSVEADGLNGGGYMIDAGCHGSPMSPEYFRVTLEADDSVAVLWIFDVEYTEEAALAKKGKGKPRMVRSDFRMGGPYDANGEFAQWARTTSMVDGREVITVSGTGDFAFVHYRYREGFVLVGVRTLTLNVTLTEIG